jgi:hypothetical protein
MRPLRFIAKIAVAALLFGALPAAQSEAALSEAQGMAKHFVSWPESAEASIEGCRHIIGSVGWQGRLDTTYCISLIEGIVWASSKICAPNNVSTR